jgi:hypothetical protein
VSDVLNQPPCLSMACPSKRTLYGKRGKLVDRMFIRIPVAEATSNVGVFLTRKALSLFKTLREGVSLSAAQERTAAQFSPVETPTAQVSAEKLRDPHRTTQPLTTHQRGKLDRKDRV